jgi:hypothetical protein
MRNRLGPIFAVAAFLPLAAGCGGGGGSPAGNNVPHPLVRQFSPTMSPIDLNTLQANPTYTDGHLLVSTDPAYPGKIVIFFNEGTQLDPGSVFIGGNPALGIDLSALQIVQFIPGIGNVPVEPAPNGVEVLADRIIFTPAVIAAGGALPDGQYTIAVFGNLKSTEGDPVQQAPVFHSFTVGAIDTVAPEVVVTDPINGAVGIGAGVAPPPPPPGVPSSSIANVRTTIFGPTTPDVIIRFSESIDAVTVNTSTIVAVDAGSSSTTPPNIPAEPGFPKLKSQLDGASLPSNGFEVVWRADVLSGGFPFGTQIQVQVVGSDGGANTAPIRDRTGNMLASSYFFQFQTIAPPDLPKNGFPENSLYWSTSDRVGTIDTINQPQISLVALGIQTTPVVRNVIPQFTDTIATKATLGINFDPTEISVDARTNGTTGHSFWYVISNASSQVVILNTRTSLPVAIINTPTPGGISNQTGGGQAANVLLVTNASANTITTFNIASYTVGTDFLNGPIFIDSVAATGNTPRAITISAPVTGAFNREFVWGGPGDPLIFYADFADGVVNTTNLNRDVPVKQFALGSESAPNDISMTPCFGLNPILFAAISEGGTLGEGKVAYYITGPGCTTGFQSSGRPDSIVGDVSGLDAPAGLDNVFPTTPGNYFFAVAESGANQINVLGLQPGTINLPQIVRTFSTGDNPTSIAHRPSYPQPGLFTPETLFHPYRRYSGLAHVYTAVDGSGDPSNDVYVCVRGAGRVEIVNVVTGSRPAPPGDQIAIPGIRFIAGCGSQ